MVEGFSKKYNCTKLVRFVHANSIESALQKAKQMKRRKRVYKEDVINERNPSWDDLSRHFMTQIPVFTFGKTRMT